MYNFPLRSRTKIWIHLLPHHDKKQQNIADLINEMK